MGALVPMNGTELERLVITLLVLLDQALKAYIAADFVAKLTALEEKQQARHPAVPDLFFISIVDKRLARNQGIDSGFFHFHAFDSV